MHTALHDHLAFIGPMCFGRISAALWSLPPTSVLAQAVRGRFGNPPVSLPVLGTALCTLFPLGLGACDTVPPETGTYTVHDSAGIQIVENLTPSWRDGEAWAVDPDPVFDLSGRDDNDLFGVGSPQVLPDGRVMIFNRGTCQLRFYDENKVLVATSGRCGSGPGEYRQSAFVWPWRGDSLVVFDWDLRRMSFLDSDGELGRTALVPGHDDMPRPRVLGPLVDGSFVLSGQRDPGPRNPLPASPR